MKNLVHLARTGYVIRDGGKHPSKFVKPAVGRKVRRKQVKQQHMK